MCYHDILFKMDILPHATEPTTSAYKLWYGRAYDMLKPPLLDFGCVVMAHIPTSNQGMLTDRAVETYYVGVHANERHGRLLLYNPVTKHTIVRLPFRVMGSTSQEPSQRIYEATYEIGLTIRPLKLL